MYIYIYACGAVIINRLWTLEKKRSKKGYRFGTSIFDRNWYSFHSPWTVRGTFYHTGPKKNRHSASHSEHSLPNRLSHAFLSGAPTASGL